MLVYFGTPCIKSIFSLGNASFAANILGARGALLSVLAHFFEHGRWGYPVDLGGEGQSLTAEDQLFVLTQAGLYLSHTRGMSSPEAQICWERAEPLCHLRKRPELLYSVLVGQLVYSLFTDKLSATMQIAKRVHSLAREQKDPALIVGACCYFAATLYYSGDFESARQYAIRALQIWRSGSVQSPVQELFAPAVHGLVYKALTEWHFGEVASCQMTMAEAISLAKELNDMGGLGLALYWAALLAHFEGNTAEVDRLASDLIELTTRQGFASWLPGGVVLRGWARSASGKLAEGISCIEDGIRDYQATGATLRLPYFLSLKAEALHLADRTVEALEAKNKRKLSPKDQKGAGGVPKCTGSALCFLRLWVLRRPKFRLRSAPPSTQQGSRSRFRWRNAPKQPMPNTAAKKRAGQGYVDCDYLFDNFLQRAPFRSMLS
jgi:Anaphase-promoting complex subunit 5